MYDAAPASVNSPLAALAFLLLNLLAMGIGFGAVALIVLAASRARRWLTKRA